MTRSACSLAVALLVATALPRSASGQSCLGLPSFANPFHVTAGWQLGDDWNAYSARLAAGRARGVFGSIGGGRFTQDRIDGAINSATIEVGTQIALGRMQLCPVLGGRYGAATRDYATAAFGRDIDFVQRVAAAGFAFGAPTSVGVLRLLPNAALRYQHAWLRFDAGPDGSTTTTEGNGLLDLGLGVMLWERLSITPTYSIEFATKDGVEPERYLGVVIAVAFGGGR
jgi:hypothetical protein